MQELRDDYERRLTERGGPPDAAAAAAVRESRKEWPKHFPSASLLGCVYISDCIDQPEYQRRVTAGEIVADEGITSDYLFVVSQTAPTGTAQYSIVHHTLYTLPYLTTPDRPAGSALPPSLHPSIPPSLRPSIPPSLRPSIPTSVHPVGPFIY